jgi:hypothetical protein
MEWSYACEPRQKDRRSKSASNVLDTSSSLTLQARRQSESGAHKREHQSRDSAAVRRANTLSNIGEDDEKGFSNADGSSSNPPAAEEIPSRTLRRNTAPLIKLLPNGSPGGKRRPRTPRSRLDVDTPPGGDHFPATPMAATPSDRMDCPEVTHSPATPSSVMSDIDAAQAQLEALLKLVDDDTPGAGEGTPASLHDSVILVGHSPAPAPPPGIQSLNEGEDEDLESLIVPPPPAFNMDFDIEV